MATLKRRPPGTLAASTSFLLALAASAFLLFAPTGTSERGSVVLKPNGERIERTHEIDSTTLLEEEPGTYLLTDFLVRSFERTVIQELGLDRYPELRDTYFANYTRVVWLTAKPTGNLRALAEGIATTLTLPLTIVDTRQDRLDSIIAQLVRMPSSSSNPIRSAHLTCPDSPSSDRGAQPVDTPS